MIKLRRQIEKAVEGKLETIKTVRVLEVHALGPKDVESLLKFMHEGRVVEELIKENIELRSKYLKLEAELTFLADKITSERVSNFLKMFLKKMKEDKEDEE